MDEFVNHDCIQNLKYTNEKNEMSSKDNKCLPDLITILKDEITFLRNEVQSKDKIIELIIKDKYNDSAEKNASFVGKSIITNTESKIITENNITNDQKFKLNEKVASNKKRLFWVTVL